MAPRRRRRDTCPPITLYGNPVLRTPAVPVTDVGEPLVRLVDDLFATMRAIETGVGLAANQIGRSEAVFVFDCGGDDVGHVVNPELEVLGEEEQDGPEGCLSLPGVTLWTGRAERARVRGIDAAGDPVLLEGEGLVARCFQHEVQHLQGRLYVDLHPLAVRNDVDATLRSAEWFGLPSVDPRSELYRRAQAAG